MKNGVELIRAERERQKSSEHYSPEHDSQWEFGELVKAAISYALAEDSFSSFFHPEFRSLYWWPWDLVTWKPKDRISNLVRAGALIAAEIDRLNGISRNVVVNHEHIKGAKDIVSGDVYCSICEQWISQPAGEK